MKTRRTAAVIAVAAAAMFTATLSAGASEVDPVPQYPADACQDPNVDCGYDDFSTDTGTEAPAAYQYAAGSCRTRWVTARRRNYFWVTMYKYNEQVRWCWKSNKITYFWRDRWPSDTHWGWAFDAHIGSNCIYDHCPNRGVGTYSTDAWTQGQFHVCLKFCIYKYAKVDIWVHGDGGSGASWSGA